MKYGTYLGRYVHTANGVCYREKVAVEMMLMRADQRLAIGWSLETTAVTLLTPGQHLARLSGGGIMRLFYFATSPGNANLYGSNHVRGQSR